MNALAVLFLIQYVHMHFIVRFLYVLRLSAKIQGKPYGSVLMDVVNRIPSFGEYT